MSKLKITAAEMVRAARAKITEIETDELINQLEDPDLVIIDIRDIRERQKTGFIPGSYHAPRGMLEFWVDPDSPYFKPIFGAADKRYVFHCASGWRSALSVAVLNDMGFDAAHLKEGFSDWVKQGGPVDHSDTGKS
ncbi:Rhodanese-related sulfurtransferase [SAR116 cluster alpha proteobacterium HIMB100]|nr:Rhodanese-related sulfurtransferase [SAR116 cluster alpha proteobacterium HIMB100]